MREVRQHRAGNRAASPARASSAASSALDLVAEPRHVGEDRRWRPRPSTSRCRSASTACCASTAAPACASGCPCARARAPRSVVVSSVTPRFARPAATPARSLRSRLMSSIARFYQRARACADAQPLKSSAVARLRVALAQRRQPLADALLDAALGRLVEARVRHVVGQVALARGVRVRLVVRVAIALAVAELLHQLRSARCASASAPAASRPPR